MPALPGTLPWDANSYLLLDGVSVEALSRKLYQWSENPVFEPLYLRTEWQELADLSPCLIALNGQHDPIMQRFIDNAAREWGYLLFTHAGFDETLRHLRWLLRVRCQEDETVLLRLADPAVAHRLLAIGNPRLFGPIEQLCIPDAIEGVWYRHRRAGPIPDQRDAQPYRLSDQELTALGEVSFRQTVMAVDEHMRTFFPTYQPAMRGRERLRHLRELAERAYQSGMCSEREILLFANVFGFLGGQPLDSHPDIARLLDETSSQSPAQRVEQAARLAERRATEKEGMLS
ncbi:DUF4123 domain-containing protein [Pseudomonas lopnurensis]|uniref:DUF4123 domain-containing protein n=1 Tax=Pseudomonas lopnurensis TaxID=1477517 RepID=UPI0028A908A5|nr:DUF4123 domain-containing protein [Pseudomonas lopnurensis]